jgi:hypothetical protein
MGAFYFGRKLKMIEYKNMSALFERQIRELVRIYDSSDEEGKKIVMKSLLGMIDKRIGEEKKNLS